ncbi:hypothetical protein EIP91_007542 [Steccherinum ochraceum]|uniref:SWI5-dependent HO expression protein 3 n=1 Tax=Steccherinum ochraceum TaxID=92696 RepID=A0A4R0RI86_9APHY|nr:hypothetical protein EIP91_007542 [Steccherinum ochraceum]
MSTPIDSYAHPGFFAPAGAAGTGYYSSTGQMGFYPVTFQDMPPSMRTRFDSFGHSSFIPESSLKVEEARLQALKEWVGVNQKREADHLESESTLRQHVLSRASNEAEYAKNSLVLLELQRQLVEVQLATAKNHASLESLVVRKATADAERAEAEKKTAVEMLAWKASAEAERAEAEKKIVVEMVAWKASAEARRAEEEFARVKSQHQNTEKEKTKLELEMVLIQAQLYSVRAQAAKANLR